MYKEKLRKLLRKYSIELREIIDYLNFFFLNILIPLEEPIRH